MTLSKDDIITALDALAKSTSIYQRMPNETEPRDVVLYLQPEVMLIDGVGHLPVRVVNGEQGSYPFLAPGVAARVAAYFGLDADEALRQVAEINEARGFSRARTREIVIQSFWQ